MTPNQLLCANCTRIPTQIYTQNIQSHAYSKYEAFRVVIPDVPKPFRYGSRENSMDFFNCQLEQIIVDKKSQGYAPRNIVFIPDRQLLIAASHNGHVLLWKSSGLMECVGELTIPSKTIRCIKYVDFGENKKYLLVGADKVVEIYDMNESPTLAKSLDCEADINDIEVIQNEEKIVVVGYDKFIRVWNLKDFALEKIDVTSYGFCEPICSAIYVAQNNTLALECKEGVFSISLSQKHAKKVDNTTKSYKVNNRQGYGLNLLPKSGALILRTSLDAVTYLDAINISYIYEYKFSLKDPELPGFKFISNENGTQFLSNSGSQSFIVYQQLDSSHISVEGLITQTSGLEVLRDQQRFVIGDQDSGTILVFRSNIPMDSRSEVCHLSRKAVISRSSQRPRSKDNKVSLLMTQSPKISEIPQVKNLFTSLVDNKVQAALPLKPKRLEFIQNIALSSRRTRTPIKKSEPMQTIASSPRRARTPTKKPQKNSTTCKSPKSRMPNKKVNKVYRASKKQIPTRDACIVVKLSDQTKEGITPELYVDIRGLKKTEEKKLLAELRRERKKNMSMSKEKRSVSEEKRVERSSEEEKSKKSTSRERSRSRSQQDGKRLVKIVALSDYFKKSMKKPSAKKNKEK